MHESISIHCLFYYIRRNKKGSKQKYHAHKRTKNYKYQISLKLSTNALYKASLSVSEREKSCFAIKEFWHFHLPPLREVIGAGHKRL